MFAMETSISKYKLAVVSVLSIFLLFVSGASVHAQSPTFSPIFEETSGNTIRLGGSQVVEVKPVSESGEVLAEICVDGDSNGSCRSFQRMISFQPLCSQGEFTVDYKDGDADTGGERVTVKKNSRITIHEITSPLFYVGSYFVKNDRKAISKEFPTVPSASSYIDPKMARSLCAPGKDCEALDNVVAGVQTGPFAVGAYASGVDIAEVSADERSPVVLRETTKSYCPTVQDSNPNPDRTNKLAGNLEPRFQTPGGHVKSRNFGAMQCEDSAPTRALSSGSAYRNCVNPVSPVDFITSASIAVTQWFECLEDADRCEETELFAIRVDSLFGTQTQCGEGDCGNSWFSNVIRSGSAPTTQSFAPAGVKGDINTSFSEPFYVSTPCKVMIDGRRIESIPCMWDVSPLREWYDRQRKTTGPSDPDFPTTFESYLESVLVDVDRRGLLCSQ